MGGNSGLSESRPPFGAASIQLGASALGPGPFRCFPGRNGGILCPSRNPGHVRPHGPGDRDRRPGLPGEDETGNSRRTPHLSPNREGSQLQYFPENGRQEPDAAGSPIHALTARLGAVNRVASRIQIDLLLAACKSGESMRNNPRCDRK